jgi:hypothetical protein
MASTAPSRACASSSREHALGTACATRSSSSPRNSQPSRPQSVRRYARSVTDSCTGAVSARACGDLRWVSDCATLRTTALVSGQEGGLVCGARSPPDAGDEHPAGASPQRPRAQALRDAGLPSCRWQPTGVSDRAGPSVQLGPLAALCSACRAGGGAGEGGRVPTADWFLNLQILAAGGFR